MAEADRPDRPDRRARRPDRPQQVRAEDQERRRLSQLFRFVQVELPWPLGPPDGRYLVRPAGDPEAAPSHVVVIATLGAAERRRLLEARRRLPGGRRLRVAAPEPAPSPVTTGRATIVDVGSPLPEPEQAQAWLRGAGEDEVAAGLAVLDRALHAFRLVAADPYVQPVGRRQALVARVGFGAGEQVADGVWTSARELPPPDRGRRRRRSAIEPQARLAAVLGARQAPLLCEELALRARLDLDHGRAREAALQLTLALDAALAELAADPTGSTLADRLAQLRELRRSVRGAARTALGGPLSARELEAVSFGLHRIEAALRARAAAGPG